MRLRENINREGEEVREGQPKNKSIIGRERELKGKRGDERKGEKERALLRRTTKKGRQEGLGLDEEL